ncbi:MAG: hypothetical protein COB15_02970 [Flavobacteriales bacterium]|nr:MAG: hypothetical protein COB15_02970 [Flavobacteriales bacterium]
MRLSILLLLLLPSFITNAQDIKEVKTNKGKIYAFWGWNRGWYTNSDIHFTGDNYDFTLNDVEATDRQTAFDWGVYFGLSTITIPQTNFRLGYFINDNIDISVGVDHMKYVMVDIQDVKISGEINDESEYNGSYDNNDFTINPSFLKFEHTDGLNYLNAEITYNKNIFDLIGLKTNKEKIQLDYLLGFGLGALMPKSNVTLYGNENHDEFHFAGYGFGAKAGLNITFYKFFFLRSEYKGGFINMPDIRTTSNENDRASQHFWFTQLNFNFGFAINPFN